MTAIVATKYLIGRDNWKCFTVPFIPLYPPFPYILTKRIVQMGAIRRRRRSNWFCMTYQYNLQFVLVRVSQCTLLYARPKQFFKFLVLMIFLFLNVKDLWIKIFRTQPYLLFRIFWRTRLATLDYELEMRVFFVGSME